MTVEWHNPSYTPGSSDFDLPDVYDYRGDMYDVGGIPHTQWNGLLSFVGGGSNCVWEYMYYDRLGTYNDLVVNQSPYQIELEGDLEDNEFNYNVIVTLEEDFGSSGTFLELFVAEDSIMSFWSACGEEHMARNVGRGYITMGEENQVPITINSGGESQIHSGTFEVSDSWNHSQVKIIALVQNLVTNEVFQVNSGLILNIPTDRDLDGIANLNDNCPDHANPDQEDIDDDAIGDVCDPCNGLVYVAGNVNGDAYEDYDPIINISDILAFSDFLDNGLGNECQVLDILIDGSINQWDLLMLVDGIMNGNY